MFGNLRARFADLEAFSASNVQVPARACMEALTKCYNACANMDLLEVDAQWATYQKQWETTAVELNKDAEHFNAIIYATMTPVWKAILRKFLRKPPPYVAMSHPTRLMDAEVRFGLKKTNEKEIRA
jgi:hypothetical protein